MPTSFLPLTRNRPLFVGDHSPASIDLSMATKLKDAVFQLASRSPNVGWVTLALRTITPKHRNLRRISIRVEDIDPVGDDITSVNVDIAY